MELVDQIVLGMPKSVFLDEERELYSAKFG